jgi:penicillin-insensitive murein endopeptidase
MVGRTLGSIFVTAGVLAAVWRPGAAPGRTPAKTDLDRGVAAARIRQSPALALPPGASALSPAPLATWREQQQPIPGPPRVYGRTTCGCIVGAVPLPPQGEGFVRRRPWRRTGFGHPELVQFVERLGEASRRAGLRDLMIGDMSLPRGGAYGEGHASHQTGLDVDIAYRAFADRVEERSLAVWQPSSVPAPTRPRDLRRIEALLRLAAADEHVDRIFVGARIKQLLCRSAVGDHSFLDVLRPWLGHERHFHVRLKCPVDSPDCRPNERVTSIPDDCESLFRWWKSAKVTMAFAAWRASERAAHLRDLPGVCRALAEPAGTLAQMPATLGVPSMPAGSPRRSVSSLATRGRKPRDWPVLPSASRR